MKHAILYIVLDKFYSTVISGQYVLILKGNNVEKNLSVRTFRFLLFCGSGLKNNSHLPHRQVLWSPLPLPPDSATASFVCFRDVSLRAFRYLNHLALLKKFLT